jgi:diguanylate cyclase (GGDEF)-like protein/PAS domain S-box-containing protein
LYQPEQKELSLPNRLGLRGVRAEQLEPTLRHSAGSLLGSFFLIAVLVLVFWSQPGSSFVNVWATYAVVVVACSYGVVRNVATRIKSGTLSLDNAALRLTLMMVVRGAMWAFLFLGLPPLASDGPLILVGWFLAGVMAAGAIAHCHVPAAALGFIGIVAFGGVGGLVLAPFSQTWLAASTVVVFAVMLSRMVMSNSHLLLMQLRDKEAAESQSETISLLLRDFESTAKEWLWETDDEGNLQRGETAFAKVLGLANEEVQGTTLAPLIDARVNLAEPHCTEALESKFAQGKPFADAFYALKSVHGERHVRLSAKPIVSSEGLLLGWRGVAGDVTTEKIAEKKVLQMALNDPLTGLPNRTAFYAQLEADLSKSAGQTLWLMCLDLDGFKLVNDSCGHDAGDRLLCQIAQRLRSLSTRKLRFARLGGDEFAAVFFGELHDCDKIAKEIITQICLPVDVGGRVSKVGVSIGIARCIGANLAMNSIMRKADLALYRAKQEGRNRACHYDDTMDARERGRRDFDRDFRLALENEQFTVEYQAIYEARSRVATGFEALLRWRHPTRGMVPPSVFIPFAEDTGLIERLGAFVLRKACEDAMNWPKHLSISVNVSPVQFQRQHLLATVAHALASSGLPPNRLFLELTETALLHDSGFTKKIMTDLKTLGVGLALDDFGTGYSSLYHLQHYSFDKIKIDKDFVGAANVSSSSEVIVKTIVQLARDLGMTTVAEGIETEAQLKALRDIGCDELQGYFLSHPQSVESVLDQLSQAGRLKLLA